MLYMSIRSSIIMQLHCRTIFPSQFAILKCHFIKWHQHIGISITNLVFTNAHLRVDRRIHQVQILKHLIVIVLFLSILKLKFQVISPYPQTVKTAAYLFSYLYAAHANVLANIQIPNSKSFKHSKNNHKNNCLQISKGPDKK